MRMGLRYERSCAEGWGVGGVSFEASCVERPTRVGNVEIAAMYGGDTQGRTEHHEKHHELRRCAREVISRSVGLAQR